MKHKKLVIVTKIDVLMEYLSDQSYGMFIENKVGLKEVINYVAQNDCTEMVEKTYGRYRKYFCCKAFTESIFKVFQKM